MVQVVLTGRGDVTRDPRSDEMRPQLRSLVVDVDISHCYTVGQHTGVSILAGCG
jgi:hypothetical protein